MAATATVTVDTSATGEENQTERELMMMMMRQTAENNTMMVRRRPCSPRSHHCPCSAHVRFHCKRRHTLVIRPHSQAHTRTPAYDQHTRASAPARAPRPTHLHQLLCIPARMRQGGWCARSTSCARCPSHLGLMQHFPYTRKHVFVRCTAKSCTSTPLLSTPPRAGAGGRQALVRRFTCATTDAGHFP